IGSAAAMALAVGVSRSSASSVSEPKSKRKRVMGFLSIRLRTRFLACAQSCKSNGTSPNRSKLITYWSNIGDSISRSESNFSCNCHVVFQATSLFFVAASRLEGVVDSGHSLLDHLQRLLPGILLCCVITVAATLIEIVELHFAGQ